MYKYKLKCVMNCHCLTLMAITALASTTMLLKDHRIVVCVCVWSHIGSLYNQFALIVDPQAICLSS